MSDEFDPTISPDEYRVMTLINIIRNYTDKYGIDYIGEYKQMFRDLRASYINRGMRLYSHDYRRDIHDMAYNYVYEIWLSHRPNPGRATGMFVTRRNDLISDPDINFRW